MELDWVKNHGKVFGTYEGLKPVLYVADPDLCRQIMSKDFHVFTNRRDLGKFKFDETFMNAISIIKDEQWKRVRSIMSPTFSTGKMRRMRPLVDECIQTMIGNFDGVVKSDDPVVDVKRMFGAFSMEVVLTGKFFSFFKIVD